MNGPTCGAEASRPDFPSSNENDVAGVPAEVARR